MPEKLRNVLLRGGVGGDPSLACGAGNLRCGPKPSGMKPGMLAQRMRQAADYFRHHAQGTSHRQDGRRAGGAARGGDPAGLGRPGEGHAQSGIPKIPAGERTRRKEPRHDHPTAARRPRSSRRCATAAVTTGPGRRPASESRPGAERGTAGLGSRPRDVSGIPIRRHSDLINALPARVEPSPPRVRCRI